MTLKYDLHIHSCLSPCGSDDMTPANLAAMEALAGAELIALSDHNTTRNCRAAAKAAEENGLLFVPAMELTSAEEAHILCLLPDLDAAEEFDKYVYKHLPDIKNRPEFFGNQYLMDENEEIVGIEERLLISATDIGVYDAAALLRSFGGVAIPAHIDKDSFSVLSNLGFYEKSMGFTAVEVSPTGNVAELYELHSQLRGVPYLTDSDAHYLEHIPDAVNTITLPERSAKAVIEAILAGALEKRIEM